MTTRFFFLIPCDVESIKNHLAASLSINVADENAYIDEFLRKFFNTSIWIPDFHTSELESFASSQLRATGIQEFDNEYLSWLIIKVFNKNPRQIIQFINLLVANYLMMKKIAENKSLPDVEFHKKNIPQLAKFLLVKQRHPQVIDYCRIQGLYHLPMENIPKDIADGSYFELLRQTDDIRIANIEPFLKGRMTAVEQKYPEILSLTRLMLVDDSSFLQQADSCNLVDHARVFSEVAKSQFLSLKNRVQKVTFLGNILLLTKEKNIVLSPQFYREIVNYLDVESATSHIDTLTPELIGSEILDKATVATKNDRTKLSQAMVSRLGAAVAVGSGLRVTTGQFTIEREKDFYDPIFDFIIKYKSLFLESAPNGLYQAIARNYKFFNLRKYLKSHPDIHELVVSEQFKNTIAQVISAATPFLERYERLSYMDLFHPKENYDRLILESCSKYWKQIFSSEELSKAENRDIFIDYRRMLRERLLVIGNGNAEQYLLDLFLHIFNEIKEVADERILEWIPLLKTVGSFEEGRKYMVIIANSIFSGQDSRVIDTFSGFYADVFELVHLDISVERSYLSFLAREGRNMEFTRLNAEQIVFLVDQYLKNNRFDLAEELIMAVRDSLLSNEIEGLLEKIFQEFDHVLQVNDIRGHFRKLVKLYIFLADQDRDKIEAHGLWLALGDALINDNFEISKTVFTSIRENYGLMTTAASENLFKHLQNAIRINGHYDKPYVHEMFFELYQHIGGELRHRYVDLLFSQVLRYARESNIQLIGAQVIKTLDLKVDQTVDKVKAFLNFCTEMDIERRKELSLVFTELDIATKNRRKQSFNEIKELLNEFLGKG